MFPYLHKSLCKSKQITAHWSDLSNSCFCKEFFLEHSHAHSFACCLYLCLYYSSKLLHQESDQKEKNKYCILIHIYIYTYTYTYIYRRRQWHPTPVLLPGESHGRRSLAGGSPWGCTESDTNERLHFHISHSCTEDGNGNPLQCSCLENPRDRGAWWAAVYGVAQSRTRLK